MKRIDQLEPETQEELRSSLESGELDIADFDALTTVDKKLKNFRQLRIELGQKKLDDAEREQADSNVIRYPNGKEVPRKNQYYLQNNPGAAQQHAARQQAAAAAVDSARTNLDTLAQRAAQAKAAQEKKPEPAAAPAQKPEPTQPQRTEPVDTKPQQQPQKPEPKPAPEPSAPLQQLSKKKKEQKPNESLPQE